MKRLINSTAVSRIKAYKSMINRKSVYLRPLRATGVSPFGSKPEPVWEHKNCATRQKLQARIAKGSIQQQSPIRPFRQKCQKVASTVLRTDRLTSLPKRETVKRRRTKVSQFLGFTKGTGYAINIVRTVSIEVRENEKDYLTDDLKNDLELRSQIFAAMLIRQSMIGQWIKQCIKEIRGGSIKTVNHVKGGDGKGVSEGFGRPEWVLYSGRNINMCYMRVL